MPWCVVTDLLTMIAHICLPRCMIASLFIPCDIMAYLFVPYCLMTHIVGYVMSYIPHSLPMTTPAHGVHVDTVTLYSTSMYTSLYTPVRTSVSSTARTFKLYCNHQHAEIVCLLSVLKFAMPLVPGAQAIPRQVPLLCRPPSLLVFKTFWPYPYEYNDALLFGQVPAHNRRSMHFIGRANKPVAACNATCLLDRCMYLATA